jgi:hypothetical protein
VKRIGNRKQASPDHVKKQPDSQHARQTFADDQHAGPVKAPTRHGPGEPFQARRADDAVVVLGDALATEKLSALRAARDGFSEFVVQAALVRERGHKGQGVLGQGLEPNDK